MITLKINDQVVEADESWTLLETARQYGFDIPTLCFHEAVKSTASCRLCMVELKDENWSKLVASCIYKAKEGLNVYTESKRIKNSRRWILEMLLSECPSSKTIIEIANKYNIEKSRFIINKLNNKCFLCGLCTRVCEEVSCVSAIEIVSRGIHKKIGSPFLMPTVACIGCGRCVSICPTGAMSEKIDNIRCKITF